MIELEHICKQYSGKSQLKDVSAVINKGDIISVIGPSGAGKSTLLHCINMLDPPTGGRIIVDGDDITQKGYRIDLVRRKMGMVFQSFNLFENRTAIENIMAAPIDLLKKSRQEAYDLGMKLLREVGLADKALSYPDELSGGQKQRIAIARTLAMNPEIILFDEPTSALDHTMVGEVEAVIRRLAKSGVTMLIVTHDMKFAREICNRVFYMENGVLYEDGAPEQVFDNPVNDRTRRFIHGLKTLVIDIDSHDFDFIHTTSKIDDYCETNRIDRKLTNRMQLVFEEMCVGIILSEIECSPQIKVIFEYAAEKNSVVMKILYNGGSFDPAGSSNDISLKFLKSVTSDMVHEDISEDGFTNKVKVSIINGKD